ncbi:MAG: hypothetical protein GXP44_00865 [bacterium]|nr:hypothetical protein [bacterium]
MTGKENTIKVKIFGFLMAGIFLVSGFYVYFLSAAVIKTVERKQSVRDLQKISAEYQDMEENYFKILNGFNLAYAESLGFVSQKESSVIIRQTSMARR